MIGGYAASGEIQMRNINKVICCTMLGAASMLSVAAKAQMTDADKTFISTAAQSDINEIKLSQLAQSKASSAKVKSFAAKMVSDHQTLEMKMKPFADQAGVTPPADLDAEHQAIYDKLNGLSGADFDKEYMTAMAADHHKALDLFTAEESAATDSKFKKTVAQGRTVVAMHTKMADGMSQKMTSM